MTFIANPSGGTPPYKLSWYSAPATGACTLNQIASQTGSELNTTPSASSINYCYKVSASAVGFPSTAAVTSAQTGVIIDSALVAGDFTPFSTYGDAGGTELPFTITAAASGGTGGPYTYQWYSGTSSAACSSLAPIAGAHLVTYSVPATTAVSTFFCYSTSDASTASTSTGHPIVYSAVGEFEVNATLKALPITTPAGPPAIDMGTVEIATLQANPTGGAGLECTGVGAPLPACLTAGQQLPGYEFTWTSGVYPTCGLDTTPVGGPLATLNQWDATVLAGSLYYCYSAYDGNTTALTAVHSTNGLLVTVYPALVANVPAPGTPTIDFGRSVTLSATPTGGTGTYVAYQWYEAPYTVACGVFTLIPGATSATYSAASGPSAPYMTATGQYCFAYSVQDNSNGTQAMETSGVGPGAVVTVDPALVASVPIVHGGPLFVTLLTAPYYVDQAQAIELTATPSGGTLSSTYVFQWYFGSSAPTATGCSGSALAGDTTQSIDVTPTATGFYCYTLTDGSVNAPTVANGTLVSWNATLTAGAITAPGTVVDLQTVWPNVDVNITANPAGGTAAYNYVWTYGVVGSGGGSLCTADTDVGLAGQAGFPGTMNLQTLEVDPTVSSYYCYTVTDSANTPVTVPLVGAYLIQVAPPLVANPAVTSAATIDVGQSAVLTAIPSGGTGVYVSYQWFVNTVPGCTGASLIASAFGQTYVFSPTVAGPNYFCYRATDSSYGDLEQRSGTGITAVSVTVTVSGALIAGIPTCSTSCAAPTFPLTLTSHPSVGSLTYTAYQWYTGPSSVCSLDSAIFGAVANTYVAASSTGQYFCYGVTDSNGATQLSPTVFVAP